MMYVRPWILRKENKSAACFVFATTTWSWSRASSVPSHPLLCMSMGSRALNRNRRSKKLEWKKKPVSCECSGSIFKKYKKNYCDKKQNKKQFTHQSDSESLRSFNEKRKTTSDSRAAISSSAPPKWRKTTKKIEIESVFHVFSTTLQKDELFSFWWPYLMPARPPSRPPKP